jgi:hypothetical protein
MKSTALVVAVLLGSTLSVQAQPPSQSAASGTTASCHQTDSGSDARKVGTGDETVPTVDALEAFPFTGELKIIRTRCLQLRLAPEKGV